MVNKWVAGAALCALLLLPVGCSQAEEPETTAAAVDVDQFQVEYASVSERYQERVTQVQQQGQGALGQGPDAIVAVYQDLRDAVAASADELDDLEAPPELTGRVAHLRQTLRRQVRALDSLLVAVGDDDEAGVTSALSAFTEHLTEFATAQHALDQELAQGP